MPETITGMHWGSRTLSAATLRRGKKGWMLVGGALHVMTEAEAAAPAAALRATARAARHGSGPVVMSLPRHQAIVRKALLPSTNPAELAQMARFEAERHIPLHPERHATGFHILRSLGLEGSEVLLGAVDGPVVEQTLRHAEEAGLTVARLTLSSIGLVNSLLLGRGDWVKGRSIALLSIGLETLDLVLMTDGIVHTARSVQLDLYGVLEAWAGAGEGKPDAQRLGLAARMIDCLHPAGEVARAAEEGRRAASALLEQWLLRLVQEVRRTCEFARRESRCPPPDTLVLTGEGAALRNLDQYLLTALQAEPLVLQPASALGDPAALKLPFGGLELAIAIGAAMSDVIEGGYRLDLLPEEVHRSRARRALLRRLSVTGALAVVTAGLVAGAWLRARDIERRTLDDYTRVLRELEPRVAELNEMKDKLAIIRNFLEDPNSALEVLNTLSSPPGIPETLSLTTINYVKGREVVVDGEAREVTDINGYISALKAAGKFVDVVARNQTTREMFGQRYYQFQLEAPLRSVETSAGRRRGS